MQVESSNFIALDKQFNRPKISVCVVTYNQEKYIRQCLQSIVDQSIDSDIEVIVADDCSSDKTRSIIREFHDKYPKVIKPIFHNKNMGAGKNFLYVHQQAMGKYVAHMDGDDYALPGKIRKQVEILDADEHCNAVWHKVDYFDDNGRFCTGNTADFSVFRNGLVYFEDAIRLGFVGVHSSLMYRRSAREVVSINYQCLDLYFTWDLLSKGRGRVCDDVLGRYRVAASGSVTMNGGRKIAELTVDHARLFFERFPSQRENFFIWGVTNFLAQLKNRRSIAFLYLGFCARVFCLIAPSRILLNIIDLKKIQVKWSRAVRSGFRGE